MLSEEGLHEKYKTLDDIELLEIVAKQSGYTEFARSVALDEIRHRNIPINIVEKYKSVHDLDFDPFIENWFQDLKLWQKMLFYTLSVFRHRFYPTNKFYEEEYYLKIRQSNYYLVTGFSFITISLILNEVYKINFLTFWLGGFSISYAVDILINKKRQIQSLQKITTTNRRPRGVEI